MPYYNPYDQSNRGTTGYGGTAPGLGGGSYPGGSYGPNNGTFSPPDDDQLNYLTGTGVSDPSPDNPPGPTVGGTPPASGGSGGGANPYGDGLLSPRFGGNRNLKFDFGAAPTFTPPQFAGPPDFAPPGEAGMFADPGYKFRLNEAIGAMENSAAARGATRSGQSIYDIGKLGSDFASQEYGNVFDRALNTYETNFGVDRDVFDRKYRGAYDAYQPRLTEWQTNAAGTQASGLAMYNLALQEYLGRLRADAGVASGLTPS